ncbi:MAG TPA: hypothetical protein VGK29_10975 [Paludibaculum sp.]
MRVARKLLILSLCGLAALALMWGQSTFRPKAAKEYPSHQDLGKLKVAAVKFESDEETRPAFGKVNPNEYGVLPVFLILENTSEQTLLLDRMKVAFQFSGGEIAPTPPGDLPYLIGVKRPRTGPTVPIPIPLPKKKNPMGGVELQTRAWSAKTLLKGESATGFFYFQARYRTNAKIYVTGIREGLTNKELFYVDVAMDAPGVE